MAAVAGGAKPADAILAIITPVTHKPENQAESIGKCGRNGTSGSSRRKFGGRVVWGIFDTSPTLSVVLMIGLRPGSGVGKLGFRA